MNNVYKKSIRLDKSVLLCKTCDYFRRNDNIVLAEGWTYEEYFAIVDFIINNHNKKFLNELTTVIHNKKFIDILSVIISLGIRNKFLRVRVYCEFCKKEMTIAPNEYLKVKNPYCSLNCYWTDKPNKVGKDKENLGYKRIQTQCTNCNKRINVIPFDYNKKNKYGDNHNFCSQECYWEFRAKYYINDKSVYQDRINSGATHEVIKLQFIKNTLNNQTRNSKIQLKVNDILDSLNIKYKREHMIKYYAVDNYLCNSGLIIEVMGDYWHGNSLIYNSAKPLNKYQSNSIHRDKSKHTYIKNKIGIEILYLWETDIDNNVELCRRLILLYLNENGILNNYHSFNYCLSNDNKIKLSDNFAIPYQNMKIDEYRHLIKT